MYYLWKSLFADFCYLWAKNILVTNVFGWITLISATNYKSLSQYPKRRSIERTLLDMVRPVKNSIKNSENIFWNQIIVCECLILWKVPEQGTVTWVPPWFFWIVLYQVVVP